MTMSSVFNRCILVVFCFFMGAATAQTQLKFEALSAQDGLLSPFVRSVVEDHNGFLWIGSQTGLQRFDGHEYKNFHNVSGDQLSLASNVITDLLVDDNNQLWVATKRGLNIYNQNSEQFSLFDFKLNAEDTLAASQVRALLLHKVENENQLVWIGTHLGLTRFDVKTGKITHFRHFEISVVSVIDQQTLLVGTLEHGLYVLDIATETFTAIESGDVDLSNTRITSILKVDQNKYFVATLGHGIFAYEQDSRHLRRSAFILPSQRVRSIERESNGLYWVATGKGLHIFDSPTDSTPYPVQLSTQEASDDAEQRVSSFHFGHHGDLWITTLGYGLFKFSNRSRQFEYYVPSKPGDKGLQNRVVLHFAESPNGLIYVGKLSGNVSQFNPQDKSFKHQVFLKNGMPTGRMITGLRVLSNDELLVSNFPGSFRVNTKLASQEITTTKQYDFLQSLTLVSSNQPRNGSVIVAYTHEELVLLAMDAQGDLFIKHRFDHKLHEVIDSNIQKITNHYIAGQDMYVADVAGGIAKISDFNSDKPIFSLVRERDHAYVDSIIVDNNQNLWIAMEGSKLVIQPSSGEPYYFDGFNEYTTGFGSLQYNRATDQLWLTSSRGLSSINLTTKVVHHYDELDGVEKYLEETGAALRAKDGYLYFGARNGFNRFLPEQTKPDLNPIIVRLTGFLLGGKTVKPQAGAILQKSIVNTQNIALTHDQNAFGFEFSGVLAPSNKSITYAYQLEGIERDWTYVSSQKRFANYTNIPPGKYTFRAKSKSKNNVWSDVAAGVTIVISPPWWQTLPAYVFYLVMVIFIVYVIVKVRTVTLSKRAIELEASVRQRTTELALEKKKVEQLLIKKDEEFANISHEFRTPLTLILGPAQQLIKRAQTAELDQLNIIERNGYRLLRMVDQLLNIETFKVEAITQKVTQHFAHSVQTIRLAFIPMAQNKNITIEIEKVEPVCAEFTQDAFEQILLNLLSNAIKYTQDGGAISLSLVRIKGNQLKLTVSDSGIGISKDQQQAIFSRFHRVHNSKTQHAVGTGIGLALVKSLVEAHQGSIEVQSEVGKGTQITLCFPIINEVVSEGGGVKVNDELINKELKSIEQHPVKNKGADSENDDASNAATTVLVIDDNADMLTYISANLLTEHQVLTATNGREGLELAIEQVPDLIVSDVMMPEIDGYELADALRENAITAHIPIILLTAKGDANSKIKGLNKQVDEYLTKPFDLQELKVRITNLLEIRKILRKRFAVARFGGAQPSTEGLAAPLGERNTENEKFVTALDEILEDVYSDMELRVGSLADGLHISERQLFRKLKSTVDMSPTEYLRNFRLLKAAGLLRKGQKSTVVALDVGFSSASYFTKCFRAQFGVAPSEF